MNLAKFPRRRYTQGQTPIEKLSRLSAMLGGPSLYVKRDDLLGLTAGGNKTRKLEFLVAEALSQGADTLITGGAVQSNHCRLTLAAAVREGMKCRLILEERVAGSYRPDAGGNIFLFRLLGVEEIRVVPGGVDMMQEMQRLADDTQKAGGKPYIIPVGGSNALGDLGYVACAEEILSQCFELSLTFDYIVCASGSGGTQSGLVAGFYANRAPLPVIGINVVRNKREQEDLVYRLVRGVTAYIGVSADIPRDGVNCFDAYLGPGYSLPTPEMAEAIRLTARTEGILLDPCYTGKAMAGLIDLIRKGYFQKEDQILFLHTGGIPALYVHSSEILEG
ncbi:MAG: D-cysteine desulfhydrase [Pseudomonadota bacterium]